MKKPPRFKKSYDPGLSSRTQDIPSPPSSALEVQLCPTRGEDGCGKGVCVIRSSAASKPVCMCAHTRMHQSSTNLIREMLHGNDPQRDTVVYTHVSSMFLCVQRDAGIVLVPHRRTWKEKLEPLMKFNKIRETATHCLPENVHLSFTREDSDSCRFPCCDEKADRLSIVTVRATCVIYRTSPFFIIPSPAFPSSAVKQSVRLIPLTSRDS